ncbi:hypothetical protein [uncultured Chitinophaga sp.]|uniref:hypothetical protein n=1 Tax=uncultured Chitinophaga sp. TaxID=339340 RepID=UPI00261E4867|nr:hypothetical protein [uncultured Chitinophaga sp.]
MKKLKISLIAIALIIGGVQAYGGRLSQTYYCAPGISQDDTWYYVAASSPAMFCTGGQDFTYVCTFSSFSGFTNGAQVAPNAAFILSTYP